MDLSARIMDLLRSIHGAESDVVNGTFAVNGQGQIRIISPLQSIAGEYSRDEAQALIAALENQLDLKEQADEHPEESRSLSAADVLAHEVQESVSHLIGVLFWYSIMKGQYDPNVLLDAAKRIPDLPAVIVEGVIGRTATKKVKGSGQDINSAWHTAVNLTGKGRPDTVTMQAGVRTVWLTEIANDGIDDHTRILWRKNVDDMDADIGADRVAILRLDEDEQRIDITWDDRFLGDEGQELDPSSYEARVKERAALLIQELENEMLARLGMIDDKMLRQNVMLPYLASRNRVTAKKSGGIYLIPVMDDDDARIALLREIKAIEQWVNVSGIGNVFATELREGGANTIGEFRTAADVEVLQEIAEIQGKLDGYAANPKMNDGSRANAAKDMLSRIEKLQARMRVLSSAFRVRFESTEDALDFIEERAANIKTTADAAVATYQKQRKQEEQERKRQAKIEAITAGRSGRSGRQARAGGKKVGSARTRAL